MFCFALKLVLTLEIRDPILSFLFLIRLIPPASAVLIFGESGRVRSIQQGKLFSSVKSMTDEVDMMVMQTEKCFLAGMN